MTTLRSPARRAVRGISLIEAAIAVAVMSIGILALVGVQTTLRFNNDLARQRVDASRIAAQEVENLRFFTTLDHVNGAANPAWDDLASRTVESYALPDATNNATFRIDRSVQTSEAASGPLRHSVEVAVTWDDRNGATNKVELNTVIAAVEPRISSLLSVVPSWPAFARRSGRALSIPVSATPFDDGTSGFKPSPTAGVVWRFDNTSGYITSVCTGVSASQAVLAKTDLTTCTDVDGRLVSGTVQFDLRTSGVTTAVAAAPLGPALPLNASTPLSISTNRVNLTTDSPICFANSPATPTEAAARSYVDYFCLVKLGTDTTTGWGGKLDIVPAATYSDGSAGWAVGTGATDFTVCRYTTYKAAAQNFVPNNEHPQTYCRITGPTCTATGRVTENLPNQNFLVVRSTVTCPLDSSTVSAAAGVLVNYNTVKHQP